MTIDIRRYPSRLELVVEGSSRDDCEQQAMTLAVNYFGDIPLRFDVGKGEVESAVRSMNGTLTSTRYVTEFTVAPVNP